MRSAQLLSYSVKGHLLYLSKKQCLLSANLATTSKCQSKWADDVHSNPLNELQSVLQVPISHLIDNLFEPSKQEIEDGSRLFQYPAGSGSVVHKPDVDPSLLPNLELPEVCFLGRSNVGKSSLIGKLLPMNVDVQKHVKISGKPGFTKALKIVQVKNFFCLVDMPGYGHHMPAGFVEMVEEYLKTRRQLVKSFLLIDGNVGFQVADQTAIQMLEEFGKPYTVIMTKIDKSTPHKTLRHIMTFKKLSEKMPCCFPQPLLVSSLYGYGIPFLQAYIAYVSGNLAVKGL